MPTLSVLLKSQAVALAALLLSMILLHKVQLLRPYQDGGVPYLVTAAAYFTSAAHLGRKHGLPFDTTAMWVLLGLLTLAPIAYIVWFVASFALQSGSGFH